MAQVRSELMWQAVVEAVHQGGDAPLDVLDLGGGTGIDAVRLAADGHRVTVVDPSPDALASLARRAAEAGVTDNIRSVLGDAADLAEHVDADTIDLVLCHGLLEYLENPDEALQHAAEVLRSGGVISVVVPGRLGAVLSKALSGDFRAAESLLMASAQQWQVRTHGPRRYISSELYELVSASGFEVICERGLRVFADLVPTNLVDEQPDGPAALIELERLAGDAFRPVAAGLQSLARLE